MASRVLARVAALTNSFGLDLIEYPWSCVWYQEHGRMMPVDGMERLRDSDAILLGAIGSPLVPDHVSLRELLLPIRQSFDQYVNLRPIQLLEGVRSPLRGVGPADLDILCIRENSEGEYVGLGGAFSHQAEQVAIQTAVFTETAVERIVRYACDRAAERRHSVASASKANALQYTGVLWEKVAAHVAADYPGVNLTAFHVDALAARFVSAPETLDVVVASNLFGDILTDLGAALQGGMELAASANLNPERRYPSMFEPVHGSAPTIAGQGIANPIGAVWSAALMLSHLGERESSEMVMRAVKHVARSGPRTSDLGGVASTSEVSDALIAALDHEER